MVQQRPADHQRRTQEQRSAAMRQRLLDATVESLVTYGYAGTTTARVAELAGVTRGAQVHHFPTKADLVTAAVRYLATKRVDAAFAQIERLREAVDPIGAGLDLLWQVHQEPVFAATVELWVAARVDPELCRQVETVEPLATGALLALGKELFPGFSEHAEGRHFLYTAMDTVMGIALSGFSASQADATRRWRRARGQLRKLAEQVAGELAART